MVRAPSRQQLLNQILDSMAIYFLVVNRTGRVTYASRGWKGLGAASGALGWIGVGADYLAALRHAGERHTVYARSAADGLHSVLQRQTRSFSLEYSSDTSPEARWFLMRVDPMPARHGGVVVCHLDITERVRARQRLHESLERYELATLSGRIALWEWEVKTGTLRVDPTLKQLLGFENGEIADRMDAWVARVHPEDRFAYTTSLEAHVCGAATSVEIEHRKLDARGNVRWFLTRGSLRPDGSSQTLRMLGLDTEITERKTAELQLIRETRRYQNIFAAAGVGILEADYSPAMRLIKRLSAEGITDLRAHLAAHPDLLRSTLQSIRLIDANPQAIQLAGASSKEVLLACPQGDITLDAERHFLEQILALADGREVYETEMKIRTFSGQTRDIVFTARFPAPDGLQQTALLTGHDVTELASFQRRYEMAASAGSVSVFDHDLTTGFVRTDTRAGQVAASAYSREDWLAQVYPDDVARVLAYESAMLSVDWPRDDAANSPLPPIEYRMVCADGPIRWLLKRGTLMRALDGKPVRLIGTLTDVTTLKRGEAALRRTHRQIRELTARLIATQEAERRRIARELHDDVNQRLAGAAISLSNLQQKLAASTVPVLERVGRLQSDIHSLIVGIRRLSHELHPGILEHAGLEPAVRSLCHEFGAAHGLDIRVDIYDLTEPLPPHVALCCYRVVQEALQNVVHQGGARACTVRLYAENESLILSVRESGGSAQSRSAPGPRDFDLFSAKGRVRLLGGRLRVANRNGHGLELRAMIPVEGRPRA
ncbi:MAG: PAS domain-containing protein [Longimicrobiales bacterium]